MNFINIQSDSYKEPVSLNTTSDEEKQSLGLNERTKSNENLAKSATTVNSITTDGGERRNSDVDNRCMIM